MFNVGGGEVLVIALIALIVLGPQRLPDAARQVGKAMGELRRLSSGFQSEMQSAFHDSERIGPSAPRRDVLGLSESPAAIDARPDGDGGSPARPRRRTPLRADPAPEDSSRTGGP